jgi:hypothetical protein
MFTRCHRPDTIGESFLHCFNHLAQFFREHPEEQPKRKKKSKEEILDTAGSLEMTHYPNFRTAVDQFLDSLSARSG